MANLPIVVVLTIELSTFAFVVVRVLRLLISSNESSFRGEIDLFILTLYVRYWIVARLPPRLIGFDIRRG